MLTCLSCGEARIRAVGAGTGARLPRCYGAVSVQRTPGSGVEGDIVRGPLLENIASTTLRQFVDTWMSLSPPLPLEVLKAVCDGAVALVDRVSDLAGLNTDVRLKISRVSLDHCGAAHLVIACRG